MSRESLQQTGLKQKMTHEAEEFVAIFLFLAIFFEAFAAYRVLLSREFQVEYIRYAAPITAPISSMG